MSLLFSSDSGKYCVLLLNAAIETIQKDIKQFHPLETGGILLGCYDSNLRMATVHAAVPAPSDSKHGRASFERGTNGIMEELRRVSQLEPPLHYLGEWHSHPSSSPSPSTVDSRQMQKFVQGRQHGVETPLLLIVGGGPPFALEWRFCLHRPKMEPLAFTVV
ncbi:integrative and conjugative element protein (TIGR02256 family) [Pontibacter ummariensis]|uniref:Integrative and conjugative element protein, VC0181 family n=1 Tax=Pontibacter ummariensis TaxID=1610492 RepID=A0A239DUL3_9BACT|nr:Mov34/MPN/PAD-1 family protein [Pontibacter ummariensis]PRY13774.1 integrative and conjugative element protein (TIGR02256 family) [Pontibacter ummariensis]SNS35442.1 integrative and conjugative element protein, VC0181 family [Pontibacter ummariensis]